MKRIIAALCAVLLLFPAAAYAKIEKDEYYARSMLSGNELEFYDALYDGIAEINKDIFTGAYGIGEARVDDLIFMVANDSPELFNKGAYVEWYYNGYGNIEDVYFSYPYSGEETSFLGEQAETEALRILSTMSYDATEFEKVEYVYNWVTENIEYDSGAAWDVVNGEESARANESQTIIGGLINQKAVCTGICRTMQYLLYRLDVLSYVVTGDFGSTTDHAWLIVRIDGEWYWCDPTNYLTYAYFLMDDSFLADNDARLDDTNPPLPACTSDKYMQPESAPTVTIADDWETVKKQANDYINSLSDAEYQAAVQKGKDLNPLRGGELSAKNIDPENINALDALYGSGQKDLANQVLIYLLERAEATRSPDPIAADAEPQEPPGDDRNYTGWIIGIAAAAAVLAVLAARHRHKNKK